MKSIVIGLLVGSLSMAEAVKVASKAEVDQRLSQSLIETVKELEQLDELTSHSLEATLTSESVQEQSKPSQARQPLFQNIVQVSSKPLGDGPIMLAQKGSKKKKHDKQ